MIPMFSNKLLLSQSRIKVLWFGLISLLFTSLALAQTAQNTQNPDDNLPITITADTLVSKQTQGISIYTGHVIMTQGRTQVTGNKITLYHPNNQFQQAVALGQPAHFKRFLPQENKWVTGHADQLNYNVQTKKVILTGHAYIQQGEHNTLSGHLITYDMVKKTLAAKAPSDQPKQRIKMTFLPQKPPAK